MRHIFFTAFTVLLLLNNTSFAKYPDFGHTEGPHKALEAAAKIYRLADHASRSRQYGFQSAEFALVGGQYKVSVESDPDIKHKNANYRRYKELRANHNNDKGISLENATVLLQKNTISIVAANATKGKYYFTDGKIKANFTLHSVKQSYQGTKQPHVMYWGSCRVATPLRILEKQDQLKLVSHGPLGFVHTTTGIKQQIQIARKELNVPEDLWHYVSPTTHPYQSYEDHKPANIGGADVYVIEISSLKDIYIEPESHAELDDTLHFQLDLLTRNLYNAPNGIKIYRNLVNYARDIDSKGPLSAQKALIKSTSLSPALAYAQEHFRLKFLTEEEIIEGIRQIGNEIGGTAPIILVPHFDPITEQGHEFQDRITIREAILKAASLKAASQLGERFHVFRAGVLVKMHGQLNALDGLSHYKEDFIPTVAEALGKTIDTALQAH